MALFYGHAPAAGHAPYEEERNPSTQMVDRELVVSNEQESQASLFVCQEINSEVKKITGSCFDLRKRIGSIYDHFTNLFAYHIHDDESQENEEAYTYQKHYELQDIVYRISQMEDQIESILKIVTNNSKAI